MGVGAAAHLPGAKSPWFSGATIVHEGELSSGSGSVIATSPAPAPNLTVGARGPFLAKIGQGT